jgi:hypothetical protein
MRFEESELKVFVDASCSVDSAGCVTHDEFGFDHALPAMGIRRRSANSSQKRFRGDSSHLTQRLPDRRQCRILIRGTLNIVKSDHRDIVGNA